MRECLIFQVADDQLDLGMLTVLGVDEVDWLGAVGDEREVPPVGEELGLVVLGVQVDAADDQPVLAERGLGQLADAGVGVVGDRLPGVIGMRAIASLTIRWLVTPIE